MDNGIYIALSRQVSLMQDLEMTSNNIANVNTPGFNAQRMLFSEHLEKDTLRNDSYADNPTSYRDTSNGSIKTTGNTFDLAISGPGYFSVQTPLGVRYTKAGNFQINADGTLVTAIGYPVLGGDGGQITIPANGKNVEINGAGQISVDGEDVGQVGVSEFRNEQAMTRFGNSLYSATETPIPAEISRVTQGALEMSNVSPVSEMVRVMSITRSVDNTAKLTSAMYDLQRKASNIYNNTQSA